MKEKKYWAFTLLIQTSARISDHFLNGFKIDLVVNNYVEEPALVKLYDKAYIEWVKQLLQNI